MDSANEIKKVLAQVSPEISLIDICYALVKDTVCNELNRKESLSSLQIAIEYLNSGPSLTEFVRKIEDDLRHPKLAKMIMEKCNKKQCLSRQQDDERKQEFIVHRPILIKRGFE